MELTIELDDARSVMWDELSEDLDEEVLRMTMERLVADKLTHLYDNQENIEEAGG